MRAGLGLVRACLGFMSSGETYCRGHGNPMRNGMKVKGTSSMDCRQVQKSPSQVWRLFGVQYKVGFLKRA